MDIIIVYDDRQANQVTRAKNYFRDWKAKTQLVVKRYTGLRVIVVVVGLYGLGG